MVNILKGIEVRLSAIFVNTFTFKRYFLVFYTSNTKKGQLIGQSSFITNGCFVSRKRCIDEIIEANTPTDMTQKNTVITNVIEVKKSDTFAWLS